MGLLDLFLPAKKNDAQFGNLVYRRRAWNGELCIPELNEHTIQLEIQTPKDSDLSDFQGILNALRTHIGEIKEQIADEAFKTYEIYIQEDRKAGNFTESDYAQHPTVTSTADIWRALMPFGLTLTNDKREYNSTLWLEVDWPNPHYFVAYLKDADLYLLDVDG
jgi:hypothetical protein